MNFIPIDGIILVGLGYYCYNAYRYYINSFTTISGTPETTIDELTANLEPATSKFVKIRGKVVCLQPIKYTRSDGANIDVALFEKQIDQINEYWSTSAQVWLRSDKFLTSTISASPFAIQDPGYKDSKNYINVVIDGATQINKLVASKVFIEAGKTGFWKSFFDYLRGKRILGYMTTETIVACGTNIFSIGEVTKHINGYTELHKPQNDKPYYLIFGNEQELLDSFYSSARWRWVVGLILMSLGVGIIGLMTKMQCTKLFTTYRDATKKTIKSDEEFKNELAFAHRNNSENDKLCIICKDKDSIIVLLNCGHLGFCEECAAGLNSCPICRRTINKRQKVFVV